MKTLPAGMQTDLDDGGTFHCQAYKVKRTDNVILGFTNHDKPLTFEGVTFEPDAGHTPSTLEQSTGMNIDDLDAFGFLQSDKIKADDIVSGFYDGAEITVYRVDWTDVTKFVIEFKGTIGNISRGRLAYMAEVRSLSHHLNQPTGRIHLYTCDVLLGSKKCGVDLSGTSPLGHPYTVHGAPVSSVIDRLSFVATVTSLSSTPDEWFTRGHITWTSGNNTKIKMEVKVHKVTGSNATITLWEPMPFDIQATDTFNIVAGCDKTIEMCKAKFDNVVNFQGFPRMPNQDSVLVFAKEDSGKNDGSSLFQQ